MSLDNYKFKKYGRILKSNVTWGYNLDPVKKCIIIALSFVVIIASYMLINEQKAENERLVQYNKEIQKKGNSDNSASESGNELKALQGILKNVQEQQKGINISGAESKYIKHGNNIILPVIINNAGKTIQVNMLLDTGCSITLLDEEIAKSLSVQNSGILEATIADGTTIKAKTGNVNSFKVGPINEINFLVSSKQIMGKKKNFYGLLGMNFLEKHPFIIDHNREVIVWR